MDNKWIIILLLFFSVLSSKVFCQADTSNHHSKWYKFVVQYDGRYSSINYNPTRFFGLLIGYKFKRNQMISLGAYTTVNPFKPFYKESQYYDNQLLSNVYIKENFYLYFCSAAYEYSYFDTKRWEFSVPMEIGFGIGKSYFEKKWEFNQQTNSFSEKQTTDYLPVQIGHEIQYKIYPWLNARVQGGYRYSLFNKLLNDNKDIKYNGFYFSFGLRVYPLRVYRIFIQKKTS